MDWLGELWHMSYRTITLYALVLVLVRIMGKRSLANMAPFDLVVILMIGEAAAIPIQEHDVPLLHGILPVTLLALLEFTVTALNVRSKWFDHLTQGRPRLLIRDGQMLTKNMRTEHVTEADIISLMRDRGIDHLSAVKQAWLEPNGTLSIIQTMEEQPMNVKQLRKVITAEEVERMLDEKLADLRREVLDAIERTSQKSSDERLK